MTGRRITESECVERFLAAYNEIEKHFKNDLGQSHENYAVLIKQYSRKHRFWGDAEDLFALAKLRNLIVHNISTHHGYLAVPTSEALERIEGLRDNLVSPERVIPRYMRKVIALSAEEPLSKALKIMYEQSHSQIPIYGQNAYVGLLTENGVMRWVTKNLNKSGNSPFSTKISEVLMEEEKDKEKAKFIARNTKLEELLQIFSETPTLEAVFITEHGKTQEKPIGIVTRLDILREKG